MNATPRSLRIASLAIAVCSLVLAAPRALVADPAAPAPAAAADQPKPPTAPAPAPLPPAPPRMRTIHPQVSQASFARDYRPLPLQAAASAAANEARIREALDHEVRQGKWQFIETPLRDVVANVRAELGVPVAIDMKALEDAGIDFDTAIVFTAEATTARSALRRILDPVDLTWTIRDECLLITTKEAAAQHLVTRLYPLPFGYATDSHEVDFQSLIDVIQNGCGDIATWQDAGGNGAIRPMEEPRGLVVSQTEDVHEQIEGLLRALHARKLAEFGVGGDGSNARTPVVRLHPVADGKVRADLAATLVGLCNESLPQGADPQAKATAVGDCLAVQSVSPEFHILAGQVIRGVAGVEVPDNRGQMPGVVMGIGGGF